MLLSLKRCYISTKAIIIMAIINLLIYCCYGTFFEEYEGILSSLVHGTYTNSAVKLWNIDAHFLLFWIYAHINNIFPNIQIYGITLLLYNLITLFTFGLLLYNIIQFHIKNNKITLFIFLYTLISFDYVVNLGSTRIAFLSAISVLGYIELKKIKDLKIRQFEWIILMCIILYSCLIKSEIVLLTIIIYISLLILHRRFYLKVLLLFFTALAVLVFYYLATIYTMTEARQVFYFKEFDFFDKNNINYGHLSMLQNLEVEAFRHYQLTDKVHFSLSFYNEISKKNTSPLVSLFEIFQNSVTSYRNSLIYILFAFFSGMFLIYKPPTKRLIWLIHITYTQFFPIILSLVVIVPERVLIPYYSIIGIVNVLIIFDTISISANKFILLICGCSLLFICRREIDIKNINAAIFEKEDNSVRKIDELIKKYHLKEPIIINNMDYRGRYFPIKPLNKLDRKNVLFLNLWFFNSYDCYISKWNSVCNCNALSIEEKVDYIVNNENLFIIDDATFQFMQKYFQIKYHKKLVQVNVSKFDDELNVCKLSYRLN